MYKIKTKLVVYFLVYHLPVRIPETGVRSDNEIILPINLRPASQNWDAGLKTQMRGPDNIDYLLLEDFEKEHSMK